MYRRARPPSHQEQRPPTPATQQQQQHQLKAKAKAKATNTGTVFQQLLNSERLFEACCFCACLAVISEIGAAFAMDTIQPPATYRLSTALPGRFVAYVPATLTGMLCIAAVLVLVLAPSSSGFEDTAQVRLNQALAPSLMTTSAEDRALAVGVAISGIAASPPRGYLPVLAATAAVVLLSACQMGPIHVLCTALVPIKKRRLVLGLAQLPMLAMVFLLLVIVRFASHLPFAFCRLRCLNQLTFLHFSLVRSLFFGRAMLLLFCFCGPLHA